MNEATGRLVVSADQEHKKPVLFMEELEVNLTVIAPELAVILFPPFGKLVPE